MLYPSWREFDRAFVVWWRHHPQWTYRKAIEGFNEFTGFNSEPTEVQVERIKKLAGPYGDALLAIHLAKEGMHHGTGQ